MTLNVFLHVLLFVIFFVSGFGKLRNRHTFQHALNQIRLNRRLIPILSYLVPYGEWLICACLIIPGLQALGHALVLLFAASFIWFGIQGIMSTKKVTCHCFGQWIEESLGWSTIFKSLVLISASVYNLQGFSSPNLFVYDWIELAGATFISLACLLLYALLIQIWPIRQNGS